MNAHKRTGLSAGLCSLAIAVLMHGAGLAAQTTTPAAATDSSTQASPAASTSTASTPATDSSAEASPVSPMTTGTSVAAHTALEVTLRQAVSSGVLHNGASVHGVLAAPLHTSRGQELAAGTAVTMTVVAVAPAGEISSAGEVTLQVVKVGGLSITSNSLVFKGRRGQKELADSAPAKGAEAMLAAGTALHFEVIPALPKPATAPPSKPAIASPQH